RKFGGDSTIVGRTLRVNDEPYTVIGVMQEGMRFPEQEEMWLPLETGTMREHRDWRYLQVTARLADGVSVESANAWLRDFMRPIEARFPATNRGFSAWLQPLQEEVAGEVRKIFLIMIGAVAFVLLIACANVANLLLVRGAARQREIALRSAIGATRGRIVRQLLTESLVLAVAGGALGVLLGTWSIEVFTATNAPSNMPFWMKFDVDRTVLLVSAGLTVVTGIVFGLAPALRLSATSVGETLKQAGGRSASASGWAGRLRSSLVVTQLTLSLVLLVGATLMIRSFMATQEADLGMKSRGLLTLDLALAGARYDNDTVTQALLATVERELGAIPGVTAVGFTSVMPVKHCCSDINYFPDGKEYPQSDGPTAFVYDVSPGFVKAAGMTVVEGRGILPTDAAHGERVAMIDEVFAQREWPGTSAVGRRFKSSPTDSLWTTVVGVVRHVVPRKVSSNRQTAEVFFALAQRGDRNLTVALRTTSDPSALVRQVQAAMQRIDRELPLAEVEPMTLSVWNRMFEARVYGIMFAAFGMAALVLAGIGLYGVVSYSVAQRTHEMGIRMALGAGQRAIVRLVVSDSARLVGIG
ncbi:MAG: ABC transporter permease, partial [Gemmatimonadaceae bacterium]